MPPKPNWKLHVESFIEGYHIRHAHPETFFPLGFDNLNVVELCGPHARVTYPFRRIERLRDVPPADRDPSQVMSYLYHVFPNTIVSVLSHHTNVLLLDPVSTGQTRQIMFQLAHGNDDAALEDARRDADFVTTTGVNEDLALVTSIQRSLKTGANDHLTFGKFEAAIAHFHKTLSEALPRHRLTRGSIAEPAHAAHPDALPGQTALLCDQLTPAMRNNDCGKQTVMITRPSASRW